MNQEKPDWLQYEELVIVDAKDKSRAPTVATIGEFAEIMRDVSAHKGVIICRKKPSDKNLARCKF